MEVSSRQRSSAGAWLVVGITTLGVAGAFQPSCSRCAVSARAAAVRSPLPPLARPVVPRASAALTPMALTPMVAAGEGMLPRTQAPVLIRSFRPGDAAAVRTIFADGMLEIVRKGAPKIARAVSPLLGAFCAVLGAVAVAEGCAAAWVALAGVLGFSTALLYLYVWWSKLMNVYVKKSLADDLKDIGSFYLAKPQSHFWVAVEATEGGAGHEQVLGCVALEYKDAGTGSEADKREGWGELRRMSVAKAARRRGVAKQLHQVLIAHAQAHQLKGVFLSTSSLQPEAIAMYKELGYEHVSVVSSSTPIVGRVLSFLTFETRL